MAAEDFPIWRRETEGRFFARIDVTRTLSNTMLTLPLHVITGRNAGPTLGIIATVHGDETLPAMAIRDFLISLDTSAMAGRVAAVPIANPSAFARFDRQTGEQHGKTDLHEVFPGNRRGNLTQMMAAVMAENLLDHVDAFVDFHSGGSGGRFQSRVDFDVAAPDDVGEQCLALCRAFGTLFVHRNNLAGTASHTVNKRGVPTVNAEVGGSYLGPEVTARYIQESVRGLRNVMIKLGMLPKEKAGVPGRQLLYDVASRFEVNPTVGGYLRSFFERPDDLGTRLSKGTKLGEVVDLYSFEVIEDLVATVDGYLFFSRYSGVVEAGTKAFALAEEATSKWLV